MREALLQYAKKGAITKEELAEILRIKPETIRRLAKAGKIPRVPNIGRVMFDPLKMIEVFCKEEGVVATPPRSLTIERPRQSASQKKGMRTCL